MGSIVSELKEGSRQAQFDSLNGKDTRTFLVDLDFADEDYRTIPGIPKPYDPHPTYTAFPRLLCDRTAVVERLYDTRIKVAAYYSSDYSGKIAPRVDSREPGFLSYSMRTDTVQQKVPYFASKEDERPGDTPGTTKKVKLWEQKSVTVNVFALTLRIEVNVNRLTLADIKQVDNQCGKIHTIGGWYWQFSGCDLSNQLEGGETTRWKLNYTWYSDGYNGILDKSTLADPKDADDLIVCPTRRDSFYRYLIIPEKKDATTGVITPPKIVTMRQFSDKDIDDAGARALPGNPLR